MLRCHRGSLQSLRVDDLGLWLPVAVGGGGVTSHAGLPLSGRVHPRPNSRFHSNPPPPPPPSLLFQSVPSSQTSIFPEDLVSRPTPPALLQAGHGDRTIAGPLARELAESISSQQTGAGLQPCCHEKQAGQTEDGECDTCYSQNIMYYILLVSLTVNCLCRVNSHITFTKITSEVRFCILKQKLPSPQMNLVSPD